MNPDRVWTNSRFGRVLCTIFGVAVVAIAFAAEPENGRAWHGVNLIPDVTIVVVGVVVPLAAWTSRLVLADGILTARNFGISRSMPLREVVEVDPATFPFLGLKIRRADGSGIRTLVSGRSWDELWTTRAERIGRDIEKLAVAARAASAAAGEQPVDERPTESSRRRRYLGLVVAVLVVGLLSLAAGLLGDDSSQIVGGAVLVLLAGGGFWLRDVPSRSTTDAIE